MVRVHVKACGSHRMHCMLSPWVQRGGTALMLAAYHGNVQSVQALLDAGAKTDIQSKVPQGEGL